MGNFKHWVKELNWLFHFVILCRIHVKYFHKWLEPVEDLTRECYYCGKKIQYYTEEEYRKPLPIKILKNYVKTKILRRSI